MEAIGRYIGEFIDLLRRPRMLMMQFLSLGGNIFAALMLWRTLMYCTGCESPMVVVLSGSMEPGIERGDILFLNMWREDDWWPGDIIVFKIEGRETPIVHRILNAHVKRDDMGENASGPTSLAKTTSTTTTSSTPKLVELKDMEGNAIIGPDGEVIMVEEEEYIDTAGVSFLTKGDNNTIDDRTLYNKGEHFLMKKNIIGRAFAIIPTIGKVTILLNDFAYLKYILLFSMAFFVLIGRETGVSVSQ